MNDIPKNDRFIYKDNMADDEIPRDDYGQQLKR